VQGGGGMAELTATDANLNFEELDESEIVPHVCSFVRVCVFFFNFLRAWRKRYCTPRVYLGVFLCIVCVRVCVLVFLSVRVCV